LIVRDGYTPVRSCLDSAACSYFGSGRPGTPVTVSTSVAIIVAVFAGRCGPDDAKMESSFVRVKERLRSRNEILEILTIHLPQLFTHIQIGDFQQLPLTHLLGDVGIRLFVTWKLAVMSLDGVLKSLLLPGQARRLQP